MSGRFALIIGNTEYLDPGLAQLTAPGKDAQDFASVLKDQGFCAFQDVKVLLNQTEPIVREAIDEFFDQKKPEDLLVLYFSGHGVRDELGALYLAVTNTNRFRLRSTAVKSDFIREAMDQSRSKRQVLILDCCNSGAFAQGTKAATGVSIGTATAFEAGYGRVILTASDSTQFAWEGNQVIGETENSLFTHYLVEGLKGEADLDGDGCITVDELYDYAYEKVKLVTPGQTPSKFSTKQQGEIILRQNIPIEDLKPAPLPNALLDTLENPFPDVRQGAVQQLTKLLKGKNRALARSAREVLERIAKEDDSRQVSYTAVKALNQTHQNVCSDYQNAETKLRVNYEQESLQKAEENSDNLTPSVDQQVDNNAAFLRIERLAAEKAASEKAQRETNLEEVERKQTIKERTAKRYLIVGSAIVLLILGVFTAKSILQALSPPPLTQAPALTLHPELPNLLAQQREWTGNQLYVYSSDHEDPAPTPGYQSGDYMAIYLSETGLRSSHDKRISELGGNDVPVWSPDYWHIAYMNSLTNEIIIAIPEGDIVRSFHGDFSPISSFASDGLSWSSDGKMLVFQSYQGYRGVVMLNIDDGSLRVVSSKDGEGVSLSPDNQKVAFMVREGKNENDDDGYVVYIANLNESNLVPVTSTSDSRGDFGPFLWTSDGKYLTYVSFSLDAQANRGSYEVWIVQADGQNAQPLRETVEVIDQHYYPWFRRRDPKDIWDTH